MSRFSLLSRIAGAALLVSASLASVGASPAATPGAGPGTILEGIVRTVAADTVEEPRPDGAFEGHSDDVYRQLLVVGDKGYFLKGMQAARANTRVRVSGEVTGNTVVPTSITTLASVASIPTTGTTRVLAMLVYWTAPDGVTQAGASSQLFGDTNGWYRDASYNAVGQTGKVTPWMRIAAPTTGCFADQVTLMSDAKAAATRLGYDLANYDNFVVYFPTCAGDASAYAGWAYVGAPGTWLNGYIDRRATVHEQGHNYGLQHSHSNLCSSGGLSGTCTFSDYGDPYDAMGSSTYVGHFNARQKSLLGWMAGKTADLSAGGSATLVPLASDSATATHGAVISSTTGRSYWLEYRQPVDFDGDLPPDGTDGVLIHVSGPGSGSPDSAPSLIDARPGDGISEYSATLRQGQSWTTPEGYQITVGSVTAASASVSVAIPARKAILSPSSVSFGSVPVRSTSAAQAVTLTNSGTTAMSISSIAVTGTNPGDFLKGASTCGSTLAAGASCTTPVSFRPSGSGTRTASLTVTDSAAGSPHRVALTGTGVVSVPTVTARKPAAGATGVATGTTTSPTPITVTFSEPVTGVGSSSFTLTRGTTAMSATVAYNSSTRVGTLTPSGPLAADTRYTLALTSAIRSASGGSLAAQSWTFLTGPRPTVTARTPASGATGVSRTANVTATFSEAVTGLPTTASSTGAFVIRNAASGAIIASVVSWSATSRTATLNPGPTLLANTKYTLTLSSAVKDVAGNPMNPLSWSFITGP